MNFKDSNYMIIENAFSTAFSDVIETMTGLMVKDLDINEENEISNDTDISGAMLLKGRCSGFSTISMKKRSASVLVAYMTGIPHYKLNDEEIFDGVAELINLLSGRAKTILKGSEFHFELSPPFTIVGENHYILYKGKSDVFRKIYYIGNILVELNIYFAS